MFDAREDLALNVEGHGDDQEHEKRHLEDEKHEDLIETVSNSIG